MKQELPTYLVDTDKSDKNQVPKNWLSSGYIFQSYSTAKLCTWNCSIVTKVTNNSITHEIKQYETFNRTDTRITWIFRINKNSYITKNCSKPKPVAVGTMLTLKFIKDGNKITSH